MRRAIILLALTSCLCGLRAKCAEAQSPSYSALPADPPGEARGAQEVDGIAARIEDDILTESEVRELAAFQKLVDGKSKTRTKVIQELADQWILRGEASTAKYPLPSKEEVDRAYAEFVKQFPSAEEYQKRCVAAGLTESAVRRILEQQLYLARFVDYRFRPGAQVDEKQIEAYYKDEFAPQLTARGETVPPLEDVEETIREVLVQRAINELATKWMDETRGRLKIDIVAGGDAP